MSDVSTPLRSPTLPVRRVPSMARGAVRRAFRRRAASTLLAGRAPLAPAATVSIAITHTGGAPRGDAVALLEPSAGKVSVKPMADAEVSQVRRQFAPRVTLASVGKRGES